MRRVKTITAGRLVRSVVYTVPSRQDPPKTRGARQRISSAAQARLNVRTSRDKLEQLLACNFGDGDLWVTLTYDDKHLPADRDGARKMLQRFFRQLRAVRKRRGDILKYVYCTQQILDDGTERLHHHMIINRTDADDFDDVRGLWAAGANIKTVRLNGDDDLTDKASYMCHEPVELGKPKPGEQMWTPSRGLARPVVETMDVPDSVTLEAPAGATNIESDSVQTEYGGWAYIKYWLPPIPQAEGIFYPRGRY